MFDVIYSDDEVIESVPAADDAELNAFCGAIIIGDYDAVLSARHNHSKLSKLYGRPLYLAILFGRLNILGLLLQGRARAKLLPGIKSHEFSPQ